MRTLVVNVSLESGFEKAFATLTQLCTDALLVGNDPFSIEWRAKIILLANEIPTIYSPRIYPASGGLVSYRGGITESYQRAGNYVGRILKGEKPGDSPGDLTQTKVSGQPDHSQVSKLNYYR